MVMTKAELDQRFEMMTATVDKVSRQISPLGNKFGLFAEGMALPSLKKILREQFGAEFTANNVVFRKGGRELELDSLAFCNGTRNSVVIGEIKTHLDNAAVDQLLEQLRKFPEFAPEHRGKELFGILVGVQVDKPAARRAIKEGLYVAQVSADLMKLDVPAGFRPKSFKRSSRTTQSPP